MIQFKRILCPVDLYAWARASAVTFLSTTTHMDIERSCRPTTAAYWSLGPSELINQLQTAATGLSAEEADRRLRLHGRNDVRASRELSRLGVLGRQLRSPLLLLLVFAAGALRAGWRVARCRHRGGHRHLLDRRDRLLAGVSARRRRRPRCRRACACSGPCRPRRPSGAGADRKTRARRSGAALRRQPGSRRCGHPRGDRFLCQRSGPDRRKLPGRRRRPAPVASGRRPRANAATACSSAPTSAAERRAAWSSRRDRPTQFGGIAHRLTLRPPETEFDRGIRHFGYLLTSAMLIMVLVVFVAHMFARPSTGRDAAVLRRARRRPQPGAPARHPERESGAGCADDGASGRAGPAPERHREPGQHGHAVHRQDRHADRGRGAAGGRL